MLKEALLNYFNKNRGKCIGTALGIIIAVLMLIIGFFRVLFIIICAAIGYYIGKKIDNNESIVELIRKILPDDWK
jgi:uncharacterized membrane protein